MTPDGRYIVVNSRLWRAANPHLQPDVRQTLVNRLMDARRAVKAALATGDADQLAAARAEVQASKEALGERGPPWWTDGAPDLNRRPIAATPYAQWWQTAEKSDEAHDARAETRPRQ
jgi:hypothetical protein